MFISQLGYLHHHTIISSSSSPCLLEKSWYFRPPGEILLVRRCTYKGTQLLQDCVVDMSEWLKIRMLSIYFGIASNNSNVTYEFRTMTTRSLYLFYYCLYYDILYSIFVRLWKCKLLDWIMLIPRDDVLLDDRAHKPLLRIKESKIGQWKLGSLLVALGLPRGWSGRNMNGHCSSNKWFLVKLSRLCLHWDMTRHLIIGQ